MPNYKILNASLLKNEFEELEQNALSFHNYLVALAFRKNEYCLLSTLQYRFNNSSDWKIAANNLGDHDGEITVPLGTFDSNSVLQLLWVINAPVTKISAIAIYLVNADTKKMIKVAPATGVKTIEKKKDWLDRNQNLPLNF